jgi:hypothetical protein
VKGIKIVKYRFYFLTVLTIAFTASCNDPNGLGMELLPSTDLIEVRNIVERNSISSYTFTEGPIRTDEPAKSLLGSMNDPVFGTTTIDFAAHFRLRGLPQYGTNTTVDSVKLHLYYRVMYGDTVTPQVFRVYELVRPIFADTANAKGVSSNYPYYQNVDLKSLASDFLLGEKVYTPVVKRDSATRDTFYQLITIPIDRSLGEKLANATPQQMANNDVFLQFFKGLLIESQKQTTTGGSILTLEAAYSSFFQGSALAVYYNNDENMAKERPDTLMYHAYQISPASARINSIEQDYTGTPFMANLNSETATDSLVYIQAAGGLRAKILIDGLASWRDSVNTAINRAELVFQIDTLATDVKKFPPPSQLYLRYITPNGQEAWPADFFFSPAYYGGTLRSDYTYRFNITQHMQNIIQDQNDRIGNRGFYLGTLGNNSSVNRVVLKGANSQTGIKLIVTYSKYLQ